MELTVAKLINVGVLMFLILTEPTLMCGPGPGANYGRRRPHKRTPLVFKQHVPNVSENTIGASGSSDGRISRDSKKFKDLEANYNADIQFKDEEGTGADRIMSRRCKDKLNILAISVMNQWPNVKLRVTESWDEDGSHASDSLHYEGRAADITTNDRDRTKYGMLARLAVEAGFDWVYFQSRSHVHVSVKSDSSAAIKSGGCFDGKGLVKLETGNIKTMDQLSLGDRVLAMDDTGQLAYSDVIMFLDKNANKSIPFYTIHTDNGGVIALTATHLIYASDTPDASIGADRATFARNVKKGQYVYVKETNGDFITARQVTHIEITTRHGVYAPLTKHGTIVVNSIVASCYGIIENVNIAHMAFSPVRIFYDIRNNLPFFNSPTNTLQSPEGIHWYPDVLFRIAPYFLDSRLLETV